MLIKFRIFLKVNSRKLVHYMNCFEHFVIGADREVCTLFSFWLVALAKARSIYAHNRGWFLKYGLTVVISSILLGDETAHMCGPHFINGHLASLSHPDSIFILVYHISHILCIYLHALLIFCLLPVECNPAEDRVLHPQWLEQCLTYVGTEQFLGWKKELINQLIN